MLSFFFFQAEDGIRDYKVTGVQTCALPISLVVEVAFGEWTADKRIRHAVFRGIRTDKPAKMIVRERVKNPAAPALAPVAPESKAARTISKRSEEHTSELQSPCNLVCRLLLEKKSK